MIWWYSLLFLRYWIFFATKYHRGGHVRGSRTLQVNFFGCTRWATSCFLYIDNTLYGEIPYRFWDIGHFSSPNVSLGAIFGVPGPSRSNFLVVLDGPRHVSYTSVIHDMVIFLTVFEILDIFCYQISPSGHFGGSQTLQVNFLAVLDGPCRVSYTFIIHYMVIFLTVFEILDIFRDQILPSGPFWGFPGPPGQIC